MASTAPRLPAVRSLTTLLPKGTEGGKEFARIVGLLLFQEARRQGIEFNLFDDASGDFEGLDSFSRPLNGEKAVGYQYKYYPSPLSPTHRSEIAGAVSRAASRTRKVPLEKYVIVTPDDFTNSALKVDGGDVSWFESLRAKHKKSFELEHIGHSKIHAMFLQTPHLCLFYYPSLVPAGYSKRRTIQEIRSLYDTALKLRYGRIEFVGMSVYKEEASRRIPLEHIYIPLSVVPERSAEENDETPRADPLAFLTPGARTVILGDPGSGKSTLMAFLALAGISEALQHRCRARPDNRLTLIITLRRYADELKSRTNLSLLDYIIEVTKADFSIDDFSRDFLEYYLESGQAILLFDGLDELPGSRYKSIVRKRIESFNATYPSNTNITTSRIVGYEAEVRFDETYSHFRVAKLRVPEIEKFIVDWYAARISDPIEREKNAADLSKVIANPDNEAIRDLARNPLLLTIVALVHRIDAVLPDQRVVLYQKCTETLLNTWHKAKKGDEELAKGRIERRNRLRIEAIAYWMHRRSVEETGRAVVPYNELLDFLTRHITDNEPTANGTDPAEDQAEAFLQFIKSGAGLLIEAGDELYSFIHLTFQEYLSATHLTSNGEIGGAQAIWDELGGDLDNPRWREVVRLLVASLRSTMGQRFFIDKILGMSSIRQTRDTALLLIGLLRDGIEPAEEEAHEIVTHVIRAMDSVKDADDLRSLHTALKAWIYKAPENLLLIERIVEELRTSRAVSNPFSLALTRVAIGLPALASEELTAESKLELTSDLISVYGRLIASEHHTAPTSKMVGASRIHDVWALESPEGNAAAVAGLGIGIVLNNTGAARRLFDREIVLIGTAGYGPHHDHLMNILAIAQSVMALPGQLKLALQNAFASRQRAGQEDSLYAELLPYLNERFTDSGRDAVETQAIIVDDVRRSLNSAVSRNRKLPAKENRLLRRTTEAPRSRELGMLQEAYRAKMDDDPSSYWKMVLGSDLYESLIFTTINTYFDLEPVPHWLEALRISLQTTVPQAFAQYLNVQAWQQLEDRIENGTSVDDDLDFAAWLLLLDVWTLEHGGYKNESESLFRRLAAVSANSTYAPLRLAFCVRGICLGDQASKDMLQQATAEQSSSLVALLQKAGWSESGIKPSRKKRRSPRR